MSNSSSPGPMYGAPQTPTPVPQAIAEESVVTSCYAQPERPRSSAGASYQQPPQHQAQGGGHHGGPGYQQQQQPQHYNSSQQQHHAGGYPQQPTPHYHQPGPHPPPQRPQYEALQPQQQQPVAVVQFTSQHPQPQPQQQQHYQQVHLQPQQQHPHHMNNHSNHNQHYQQHNVSQHQQQQAQHHQIKQNSPQPPHPQQHNYNHQQQQQQHPQQQHGVAAPHPQKVVSSEAVRPQGQTEVMAPPHSQPHTTPSPQPQMMAQGQPQARPQPQYYMTPGSVQQGPRPQGGQIRQWPTVRQQTPGGGQVVVRPSASGGIQMVGAQPQPQKQIQVPQVINSGGGQPRPLIISGQHPGGQRYNIIRPGQVRPQPGQPQMQQTVRYRVQPGPPGGPQPGVPVGAVLLRPEGPVQPQANIRHVQMRPGQIQRPVVGQSQVRLQHQGVIQQTDQQQHVQYSGGQPVQRYGAPQQVMVAGQHGQWQRQHPGRVVPAGPQHRGQVIHGPQVQAQGQVTIQKPAPVRQFVQQQPVSNVPVNTLGRDPNIQYNIEHVFQEHGKEVRKMPVMIDNSTVWVDVVDQSDQLEGEVLELDPGSQPPMLKPNPQNPANATNTKNLTPEERALIVSECCEQQISPGDLGRKWGCSADTIRQWVKKAGKVLPKTYKKSAYSESRSGTPGPMVSPHTVPEAQKQAIMREVLEDHISPNELAKKYNIRAYAIREWIKKAGHTLPKNYKRTMKTGNSVTLPTTPLPPGSVGVAIGEPPSIDSPPGLEVSGSVMAGTGGQVSGSPAGSSASNSSFVATPSKRIPGKLALCTRCGTQSDDLSTCVRCKRKLPDDVKLLDDPAFKPQKPDSTDNGGLNNKKALRGVRLPSKNKKRNNNDEPVCIALSDSEEDGDMEDTGEAETIEDDDTGDSVAADTNIVENAGNNWCSLTCRSIRIGNYKVLPKDKITITEKGVQIKVPGIINQNEVVTLNIVMKDILKVLVHFGKQMPLLFLYISPSACQKTRKLLKMTNSQSFYLDVQSTDETQKRITILPDKLLEENKVTLNQHFASIIQTLESKDANEILVRSSPKDIQKMKEKMTGGQAAAVTDKRAGDSGQPGPVVKFCQYPPDTAGNVSVTNEDYNCLEAEQFLNDVIIDFYLKYLQHGKFSSIDAVKDRTHIFTTYFYKRLTTRPQYGKGKTHPVEDNAALTAAEKRYDRVERWTKKVNLFEKDFIVVPINEHAHWFVCIICFPGQMGCVNAETGEGCEAPASQSRARGNRVKRKTVKKPMTIGSTTITRVIPGSNMREDIKYLEDDGSDRDEAEASDDEIEDDEEDAASGVKKTIEEEVAAKLAVRQPCILTFDSLAGSSKARTHQTLREYLACEWKKKMVTQGKEERAFNKDTMPGGSPKVQQQPNFSDCGIYLLQYVESFFKDPIKDYTLPIRSLGSWFTKDEVEGKRDNIATLIRTLAASQNPGKDFKYPQLNFFNSPEDESEEEDDEDYEDPLRGGSGGPVRPNTGFVQISSSGPQQVRVGNGSPVVMTPTKGKVLLQRTGGPGGALKMSPYTSTMVPAGVTVTPAAPGPPIRQLTANNISIRKMVPANDPIQTSPDSTSQEPESMEVNGGGRTEPAMEDGVSQSSETGVNGVKRTAEAVSCDNKRIKSDSES